MILDSPTLLTVRYGATLAGGQSEASGISLDLPLPLLAGKGMEAHFVPDGLVRTWEGGHLIYSRAVMAGFILRPTSVATLEKDAQQIFQQILNVCTSHKHSLYRVWNYVPQINAVTDALENYHRFNFGRWRAYTEQFGAEVDQRMPAASAVGISGQSLAVVFLAGSDPVQHFENPEQIPAYQYPERYGPKSPSFSRASLRARSEGSQPFLSGTSSIKGHETIGVDHVDIQTEVTCDNIRLVYHAMGKPDPFGPAAEPAQAKVYLRHEDDLDKVRTALAKCGATDFANRATYLQSDICRRDLDLEIEITGI